MPGSIWWIRRDLRLHDNEALTRALEFGDVTPVFILDPAALGARYHRSAERRKAFLFDGLKALDAALHRAGSRLIVRAGDPLAVLPALMSEAHADRVVAAEDYSRFARRRDAAVGREVRLELVGGIAARRPQEVLKADGSPFQVFTPYSRAWLDLPLPEPGDLLPRPGKLPPIPAALTTQAIPESRADRGLFVAGEDAARQRLVDFTRQTDGAIFGYAEGRNFLDRSGTSALSPYLRFGMISAKECVVAALEQRKTTSGAEERRGQAAWLNELIWRDFYLAVLYHFPSVLGHEFDEDLRGIRWSNGPADIQAWKSGRTGYPVVDAAMRQLSATGWMHNRARMVAASFLVKHLLVDWRIGEQWFMDQLIDGDPAANNGGWQWTAGVGTDAAPYFRVFNPVLQTRRFDPDGGYVRQWLPELASVPSKYIHQPWEMPDALQTELDVTIGEDYPMPIVDLAEGRTRALDAYNAARGRQLGR